MRLWRGDTRFSSYSQNGDFKVTAAEVQIIFTFLQSFSQLNYKFVSEILHFGSYSAFANSNFIVESIQIVHLVE